MKIQGVTICTPRMLTQDMTMHFELEFPGLRQNCKQHSVLCYIFRVRELTQPLATEDFKTLEWPREGWSQEPRLCRSLGNRDGEQGQSQEVVTTQKTVRPSEF